VIGRVFYNAKDRAIQKIVREVQAELERAGSGSVEVHRALDPWSPCLRELLEIIQRRSNRERNRERTCISRLPELLRKLTLRAARNSWLSLWILSLNGHTIAMEFQLRSEDKEQALCTNSDPTSCELSPAYVLH
jgi:Acetyltransferase (GNAT) domain